MTNIRLIAFNRVLLLLGGVLFCVFYLSSCTEITRSKAKKNSVLGRSELEFQKQHNRPPTPKTLYVIANFLAVEGKDFECELVLRRIIKEHPNFILAYNSLAELQMRQGRINEAIDTISSGLRINSKDSVLLNNQGLCWIFRSDYEKALEMFTMAAAVMPDNAMYRANMAVALGLMGRFEESLFLLKQVLPEYQVDHNLNVLRKAREKINQASITSFSHE